MNILIDVTAARHKPWKPVTGEWRRVTDIIGMTIKGNVRFRVEGKRPDGTATLLATFERDRTESKTALIVVRRNKVIRIVIDFAEPGSRLQVWT
ncbi:hypothetical protein [Reyranella sp. CPCC 100927]|uniref:hypothetical protein n=1 Tax=Reyranella sp. CPCC 100927 TaxID=2599616 RepID=UPI0011B42452|nr:hypothetical protein [Reyranella sp. CPCC 100927]TWT10632.1 hypothetical protein FQU96_16060 [Reyranella sp. CPCC 100927]